MNQGQVRAKPKLRDVAPEPILMEDHSNAPDSSGWATGVLIPRYIIEPLTCDGYPATGAYVSWCIRIKTQRGGVFEKWRRYSEFYELREKLVHITQFGERIIPDLPPKAMVSRFDPIFLEKRRRGLEYFIMCVVLSSELTRHPLVLRFFDIEST